MRASWSSFKGRIRANDSSEACQTEPNSALLIAESLFASREFSGLDEGIEIFAVDPPDLRVQPANEAASPWGRYWRGLLEGSALPDSVGCATPPEEGGLLLRPLRGIAADWVFSIDDDSRFISVPPRNCHKANGLPAPVVISNDVFIGATIQDLSNSGPFHLSPAHLSPDSTVALVPLCPIELRYSLPPSLIVHFDFNDLRDGIFRAFAVPSKGGDGLVRLLLTLDDAAVADSFASAAIARQKPSTPTTAAEIAVAERLERFLAAAAGAPPSAHWSTTVDGSSDGNVAVSGTSGLFPSQLHTLAWMAAIEGEDQRTGHMIHVKPIQLAGRSFGSTFSVPLPIGGVIAHPPGAGKTRIAATHIAERRCDSLVLCPGHLLPHWHKELASALGSEGIDKRSSSSSAELLGYSWPSESGLVLLMGYHGLEGLEESDGGGPSGFDNDSSDKMATDKQGVHLVHLLGARLYAVRAFIDEPQDIAPSALAQLMTLAPSFRVRWVLCGTAAAHLRCIGPLLLGAQRWRLATTLDEWRGQPSLCHVYRNRFLRDPEWACLPAPPLRVLDACVTPSQEEAIAAQIAALSGYVVDSVLLLSFGQHATALAIQERQQLAESSRRHGRRISRRRAAAIIAHDEAVVASFTEAPATDTPLAVPAAAAPQTIDISDSDSDSILEYESDTVAAGTRSDAMDRIFTAGSAAPALPKSEWTAVEAQCRSRLAQVEAKLRRLRAKLEAEARAFVLEAEDNNGECLGGTINGVLKRLAFLESDSLAFRYMTAAASTSVPAMPLENSAETWHEVPGHCLASAEWNALLKASGDASVTGKVVRHKELAGMSSEDRSALVASPGALMLMSEAEVGGDFCHAAHTAAGLGAVALLVACDGEVTRPMGYAAEQTAPAIPAAMLPRSVASKLLDAASFSPPGQGTPSSMSSGVFGSLRVLEVSGIAEDAAGGGGGVDEGVMADVVALDDATSQRHHQRMVTLTQERQRLVTSLRFASQVQQQLRAGADTMNELPDMGGGTNAVDVPLSATLSSSACPICLESASAVCVLPECFHCLCRECLQRAAAGNTSFRCPLCRVEVLTWTVSVFRTAPTVFETSTPIPPGVNMLPMVWRGLPSKLQHLVTLVHSLLHPGGGDISCIDEDDGEGPNLLIFTQFLAHVEYIGDLLQAAGISSLRMSGDLAQSMRALATFGTRGAPKVLLLSSQHHASGINLQVARHVIICHPYCTPSATFPEAVSFAELQAFEQQAIGRVRRYPQTQEVTVHRLFAGDTVEEGLYRGSYQ